MSAVAWAEAHIDEWALEDEAHQRNQQTADDFPPGTFVYLTGDAHRWIVDSRSPDGLILTWPNEPRILFIPADQLWRIDPTR